MAKRSNKRSGGRTASASLPAAANADGKLPGNRRRVGICLAAVLAVLVLGGLGFHFFPAENKTALPASKIVTGSSLPAAQFVGGKKCAQCHAAEYQAWRGSYHDLAMQDASAETVLGNFNQARFRGDGMDVSFFQRDGKYLIRAEGPDGKPGDFEVKYTFGQFPLQQYLLELPEGKLQAFTVAWDSRPKEKGGQRWFHLYPGQKFSYNDELHWSGVQQNWNFMCADCHSTNLQKNYDPARQRFNTTWSEVNVSCEACHGPGSAHVAWADAGGKGGAPDKGLTAALDERKGIAWNHDATTGNATRSAVRKSGHEIEVCAQCHSRRGQIAEGYHAGRAFLDYYRPSLPGEPLYFADGQQKDEVYTWGSFLQSRMHARGVTCSDCHQPHTLKLRAQGNAVCAQCHAAEKYDGAQHHFHKLEGKGALCVSCHMPERLYMVIDGRHDHSLRVPRPDITVAQGADKAPNACNNCHRDHDAKWAADAVAKWYGPNRRQEQTFGGTLASAGRLDMEDVQALVTLTDNNGLPPIARATALQALAAQPGPAMQQAVRGHAQDGDELVRLAAAEAAVALPPAERAAAVLPLLHDERLAIRLAAVNGLLDFPRDSFSPERLAELDAGIAEYRRVQVYNADRAEGQANLGQLEARLGNAEAATAAYEAAIRINPAFVPAYVNLADLQAHQGNEAGAEKTLRRALAVEPENAAAHHALGLSLIRGKRLKEAVSELRRAAVLRPEDARYAYVYAVALYETGDPKGAIRILKQAAARHPENLDILGALVQYAAKSGDSDTAAEYAIKLKAMQG
ncbi:MAG TPA: tetratricopeptide repeat protein [Methylophilaceae bacterium]|nr:tetratricopeptide repeat protein [Methylophilaceae bacterium]